MKHAAAPMGDRQPAMPHASDERAAYAPLAAGARIEQVDFLRGVALLGILVVNMAMFFWPFGRMLEHEWLETAGTADRAAWAVVNALFALKFISLFSLLFGFGIAMQLHRVRLAGHAVWPFALRRMGVLALVGLVHALGVWYGDILFIYAIAGVVVTALCTQPARRLVLIAGVLAGVFMLLTIAGAGLEMIGALDGPPATATAASQASVGADAVVVHRGVDAMVEGHFMPGSKIWMSGEEAAYREGPLAHACAFRAVTWLMVLIAMAFSFSWQVLAMMLLGVAAYQVGFWGPACARLRARVATVTLAVGLPMTLAAVALPLVWGFESAPAWAGFRVLQAGAAVLLPLGYAVVIGGAALALPKLVVHPVACAGRMALSVYLLESIAATSLSYWWGGALFGAVNWSQQVLLAVCIWCVLVGVATVWVRAFGIGPMEWLWRACTYGTLHPARSTTPAGPRVP